MLSYTIPYHIIKKYIYILLLYLISHYAFYIILRYLTAYLHWLKGLNAAGGIQLQDLQLQLRPIRHGVRDEVEV